MHEGFVGPIDSPCDTRQNSAQTANTILQSGVLPQMKVVNICKFYTFQNDVVLYHKMRGSISLLALDFILFKA